MSTGEFEGYEALIAQLRAGTLDAPDHVRRRVLAGRTSARQRWADKSLRRKAFDRALRAPVSAAAVKALRAEGAKRARMEGRHD